MELDVKSFRKKAAFNLRHGAERAKSLGKVRSHGIYVHYTNVSRINHRFDDKLLQKGEKWENIADVHRIKSEFRRADNGERWKVKAKSFLSEKLPSRHIKSIEFALVGLSGHKFNFCLPNTLPTSDAKARDWKHFSRKASFSPSSINCQTFFIIGMERRFFMPSRAKAQKANFLLFWS